MNGRTPQQILVRRDGVTIGLALLTVANAALYFVAAVLHLGVRVPLGFATLGVPSRFPRRPWWRRSSEPAWPAPQWPCSFTRAASGDWLGQPMCLRWPAPSSA